MSILEEIAAVRDRRADTTEGLSLMCIAESIRHHENILIGRADEGLYTPRDRCLIIAAYAIAAIAAIEAMEAKRGEGE